MKEDLTVLRPMFLDMKKKYDLKDGLVGVEIGVYKGINASNILRFMPINHIYLIDAYTEYDDFKDAKKRNMKQSWLNAVRRVTRYELKELFGDDITFIYKFSERAVNDIPDGMDFIYIDGNHYYEYVKKDIELYYPKVKSGGFIGGHDYNDENSPGVNQAVDEFVKNHNLKLYNDIHDWWVIKE